ncbi:MAG: hypothetical protein AABX78_02230 [Nanoarchaeota archaeon]
MTKLNEFFRQAVGYVPGNKILLAVFLLFMLILVPFVKLLDLWQVLVAFTLLILFSIFKNEKLGVATAWFMVAVVLHNFYVFIFLILSFELGINLLP